MAYWGFENTYGINTTDNEGNRIGNIVRFDTQDDRAKWMAEWLSKEWNGVRRECLSSKEARRIMEHDYRRAADPEDVRLGIYTMSEFVRLLSMDQLWDWYNDSSKW